MQYKSLHILKIFTLIIYIILMSYQLKSVITSYFNFEIITRFDIQEVKIFPTILVTNMLTDLNKLQEIYPEMET